MGAIDECHRSGVRGLLQAKYNAGNSGGCRRADEGSPGEGEYFAD